jgi:hypothetical protein
MWGRPPGLPGWSRPGGPRQNNPHTLDEYVDVNDFLDGCRDALALAQTTNDQ